MDKEKILKEIDKKIETLTEQGLTSTATIDALDKLVDMKKDLMEIEKMEMSKYSNYSEGGYGARGNFREGGFQGNAYSEGGYGRRGNFREGGYGESAYSEGNYGRRGVKGTGRGRYRGEEMIDEMYEAYSEYSEGREQYGAEGQTIKALEYMLESVVEFVKMLKQDASSQKEVQLIEKYVHKLQEM